MKRGPYKHPAPEAVLDESYFSAPEEAYDYLERRGYRVTKLNNWLPPANIREPSQKDRVAALYLSHTSQYGGLVVPRRCPFCGGWPDLFSPIGIECVDCGGNAPDIETWQQRKP